jgi:hypothetical protein
MYSGKGNVMLVSQLEDKLDDLTQGEDLCRGAEATVGRFRSS